MKFETLQLHGGQTVDKATNSRAVPIYQTSSYVFDSTEHARKLFSLEQEGNIYTRIGNPTNDVLEKRIALLEGGIGALAVSSGSTAITYAILTIAKCGDEILSSGSIYGGSFNLFANTLPDYGIKTTFFNPNNLDELKGLINEKTKVIFLETIGNPNAVLIDLDAITEVAHSYGIPVVVDNTFATSYLYKPFEHGADVVVYSATKYLGGHGTTIAGLIIDGGKFNWKDNVRFPNFNIEDAGYHGLKYADLGSQAFILKARTKLLRDTGGCLSPFNAFLILQGIETLSLRMERHVENARKVAKFLSSHKLVSWVSYPELEIHESYELAKKYFPRGVGSIFTFGLKGGREAGGKFIENLKIFSHLANVADAKSLIIHPATTTHSQMSKEQLEKSGIFPETIRISVGLENIDDLLEDLDNALNKSREV